MISPSWEISGYVPHRVPGWRICEGRAGAVRRLRGRYQSRNWKNASTVCCVKGGEAALNRLRDDARDVSQKLGIAEEFRSLDELIGTFLGTREAKLETAVGHARKRGLPYDPDRLALFQSLFAELRARAPVTRPAGSMVDSAKTNLAFFESYFSNYIEGTEFLLEEAMDIVFKGVVPPTGLFPITNRWRARRVILKALSHF